ncbi:MAG: TIGR03842 family LLM class F420-dependent oxidoreductase [Acidimicrobiia bacterium]|nr:TIGR03842 family LLM class F420-dependent oxidoreductase [Acidimicrobiia bacterium]MDH4308084.1 TIGR03842 family LLM class F420-dependent oxidoreductase [Acidimicrobiia bacterium]MDH5293086.1 TIGR03842 family LLM class F420-dependent oxidoreductase [Acidimicrobiia bacterium]
MDFGVVLQTDPPASRVVELTAKAEGLGFNYGWTFDSHVLWQEPFVIYSQMLAATERMIVGPMVTNPGTRDWTVLASLFATLNDMFDGRTVCGMGRGDSALRYIGRSPKTLDTTAEATRIIKDLVAGREVTYNDQQLSIPWLNGEGHDLPVWMAAYGPKALASTGTHYDGYILQLADPQIAAWTISAVKEAAAAAGRDPDSLSICVAAPAYVGDDVAHQRDQLRWFGGMVGNHVHDMVKRYGADDESMVPKVLADYIAAREGYDYDHHGRAGNPSTDFVPDEIVDRFCVLGPPENHVARIEELRALGVTQFAIYLMHDDMEGTLEAYGRDVIPAVNG